MISCLKGIGVPIIFNLKSSFFPYKLLHSRPWHFSVVSLPRHPHLGRDEVLWLFGFSCTRWLCSPRDPPLFFTGAGALRRWLSFMEGLLWDRRNDQSPWPTIDWRIFNFFSVPLRRLSSKLSLFPGTESFDSFFCGDGTTPSSASLSTIFSIPFLSFSGVRRKFLVGLPVFFHGERLAPCGGSFSARRRRCLWFVLSFESSGRSSSKGPNVAMAMEFRLGACFEDAFSSWLTPRESLVGLRRTIAGRLGLGVGAERVKRRPVPFFVCSFTSFDVFDSSDSFAVFGCCSSSSSAGSLPDEGRLFASPAFVLADEESDIAALFGCCEEAFPAGKEDGDVFRKSVMKFHGLRE